jgi:hypothetical protein
MEATLTPIMEPITIPGRISGTGVIDDLCNRIAEKLARSCDLRAIDAYSGYTAKVTIELQLLDVYPCEVTAVVPVGTIDPQLRSVRIDLGSEMSAEETESGSLERPIDPAGATEAPVKEKGWRAPRGAVPIS